LDTLSFYFVLDFDFSQRKADRLYIACACSFRHEINKFFLLLILSSSNCLSSIIIRELKLEELKSLDFDRIELLLKVLGEKDKKIEKETEFLEKLSVQIYGGKEEGNSWGGEDYYVFLKA